MAGTATIVRHLETMSNLMGCFGDGPDDDIPSDRGQLQVKAVQRRFENEKRRFDRVFCGPTHRLKHTASVIYPGLITESRALLEISVGEWSGHLKVGGQIPPESLAAWRAGDIIPPGGETAEGFRNRVLRYWESDILPALDDGLNVLVVTSGNPIRIIVGEVLGIPPKLQSQMEIDNCGLSVVRRAESRQLFVSTLNDTSHLFGIGKTMLPGTR